MILAAQGLGDKYNIIKYASLILHIDKTKQDILGPFIVLLLRGDATGDEIINRLSKIYDFNDPNDLMFIARTAKDCGAIQLAQLMVSFAGEIIN
jgi:hypothetical protein